MRLIALGLGMAVLVLALVTAGWCAEAHRAAGENEQLERQIAQLSRVRDVAREEVDRLRQPFALHDRARSITKKTAESKAKIAADIKNPKNVQCKNSPKNRTKAPKVST